MIFRALSRSDLQDRMGGEREMEDRGDRTRPTTETWDLELLDSEADGMQGW